MPHKLDVGVPLDALAPFCDAVRAAMPAGARTILFGHLGDGNVHVNVLGPDPADETVDETVLRLVAEHGGTISAEHGVGVAKARFLHLTRSAAEIAAMRAIKAALDPRGLLNPGAVLAANVNGGWVGRRGSRPQRLLRTRAVDSIDALRPALNPPARCRRHAAQILWRWSSLRPMTMRWISEVPSPISSSGASR